MNRKLTLSLDDEIIERAKIYAGERGRSLSGIVENYFRLITSAEPGKGKGLAPVVRDLLGSVRVPVDFDYDKAKGEYLEGKHLHD
jgi:hypothetical protein